MKDHAQKNEDKKKKPMMPSPPPKLERKPSIDTEPKTLLQEELKLARVCTFLSFYSFFIYNYFNILENISAGGSTQSPPHSPQRRSFENILDGNIKFLFIS